jgi:hypothetical protein
MKKVLDRYTEQISKIYSRAQRRQQGKLTAAQQKGIAYYRAAIETVQALIDAPTPAWVFLKFEKKLY